ncbi:MAG: HAMP domain-containing sensor histidine kinase, partial [Erysipelotrichaceae bacterium]
MLWLFQIVFLSAYFENMKVEQIRNVADEVSVGITENKFSMRIQILAVRNNVCGLVYNSKSVLLYQVDSLGLGCVLNEKALASSTKISEYITILQASPNLEFVMNVENSVVNQKMILYGREIVSDFGNYYIFLNTPLQPVESTISILANQLIYVTIIVFLIATVVAFYFSKRLAKPIVNMKIQASKLAKGDYNVHFEDSEFEEITELANTLNHTSQELKKMDELRRDLIANVSHDIKTPLTMIKAYAEMIKDLSGDNKIKREEHLDVILEEANHLDLLTQDMTQLSQLQSDVLPIKKDNFDIVAMLYNSVRLMDAYIKANSIEVDYLTPKKLIVSADKTKIQQVIFNFINNAIKFVGKDKRLILQVLLEEKWVRVEVIDHGSGIDEADLPHIWDRYYKIDKHHKRNPSGTGLGLSIAAAILKSHQVEFGVES